MSSHVFYSVVRTYPVARLLLTLAVLTAVLVAGCSGFADGESSHLDREPYTVDEQVNVSTVASGEDVLPGLTTRGVTDADTLLTEHEKLVANRSYTVRRSVSVRNRGAQHDRYQIRQTRVYGDNGSIFVREHTTGRWLDETDDRGNRTIERWVGPDVSAQQIEYENGTTSYTDNQSVPIATPGPDDFAGLRAVESATVTTMTSSRDAYHTVETSTPAPESPYLSDEPFTFTARIRSDGLLRHLTYEGTVAIDGDRVIVSQETVVYDLGRRPPDRPRWVETAVDNE